jgi:hypothetical protein
MVALTALLVFLTALLVLLTYLVWKVYERIAWLTGAMETHSDLMLRIEALRGINQTPIELVWWDPTIEEPPIQFEHGQPVELNRIHIFVPPHLRRHQKSFGQLLRDLFSLPEGSKDLKARR